MTEVFNLVDGEPGSQNVGACGLPGKLFRAADAVDYFAGEL